MNSNWLEPTMINAELAAAIRDNRVKDVILIMELTPSEETEETDDKEMSGLYMRHSCEDSIKAVGLIEVVKTMMINIDLGALSDETDIR